MNRNVNRARIIWVVLAFLVIAPVVHGAAWSLMPIAQFGIIKALLLPWGLWTVLITGGFESWVTVGIFLLFVAGLYWLASSGLVRLFARLPERARVISASAVAGAFAYGVVWTVVAAIGNAAAVGFIDLPGPFLWAACLAGGFTGAVLGFLFREKSPGPTVEEDA